MKKTKQNLHRLDFPLPVPAHVRPHGGLPSTPARTLRILKASPWCGMLSCFGTISSCPFWVTPGNGPALQPPGHGDGHCRRPGHPPDGAPAPVLILTVTNIPMTNPDIVTGVSLSLLFVFIGAMMRNNTILGFWTLLIAHVTFNLPMSSSTSCPS